MAKLLDFLKGKKTFLLVAFGLLALVLKETGVLDPSVADPVIAATGLGALATLRLGLNK